MVSKINYNSKQLSTLLSPTNGSKFEEEQDDEHSHLHQPDLLSNEQAPEGLLTPRIIPKQFSTFSQTTSLNHLNGIHKFTSPEHSPFSTQDSPRKQRRKKKSELESLLEGSPLRSTLNHHDTTDQLHSCDVEQTNHFYSISNFSVNTFREPRITRRVSRLIESGLLDTPISADKLRSIESLDSAYKENPATIPSFLLEKGETEESNRVNDINAWINVLKNILHQLYLHLLNLSFWREFNSHSANLLNYARNAAQYTSAFLSLLSVWMFCLGISVTNYIQWANRNRKQFIIRFVSFIFIFLLVKGIFFRSKPSSQFNPTSIENISQLAKRQAQLEREIMNKVNQNLHQIRETIRQQAAHNSSTQAAATVSQLKQQVDKLIEEAKIEILNAVDSKILLGKDAIQSGDNVESFEQGGNSLLQSKVLELQESLGAIEPVLLSLNSKIKALEDENESLTKDLLTLKSKQSNGSHSSKDGLIDYADGMKGATIVRTISSSTYQSSKFWSCLGMGIEGRLPETILSSNNSLGNCWSFSGSKGHVVIALERSVIPVTVAVEHIPIQYAINPTTAPKEMEIYGLLDISSQQKQQSAPILLCKFTLDIAKSHLIEVPVSLSTDNCNSFKFYQLNVLSNNGCVKFTCIYKVRIYGKQNE